MIIIDDKSPLHPHVSLINHIHDPLYDRFGGQLNSFLNSRFLPEGNYEGLNFHCKFIEEPDQILKFETVFSISAESGNMNNVRLKTHIGSQTFSKADNYAGLHEKLLADITEIFEKEFRISK